MVLIIFNKSNPEEWVATDQYFQGIDDLPEHIKERGMRFNEMPQLENRPGYNAVLCYNPNEGKLYYRYDKQPPQPEDIVDELQKRVLDLEMAMAAVIGGAV